MQLMTDVDYPRIEVVFAGSDAYREALVIDADDFIGVKSFKAKGKRLTTFDVETINELDPIRFKVKEEPAGNDDGGEEDDAETPESDETVDAPEAKPVKRKKDKVEKPEESKDKPTPGAEAPKAKNESVLSDEDVVDQNRLLDDITGQLTLFD